MPKLTVEHPGRITIEGDLTLFTHWGFRDTEGRAAAEIDIDEMCAAIRDYLVARIDKKISDPRFRIGFQGAPEAPISIRAERDAELEAYMLINRCQGVG